MRLRNKIFPMVMVAGSLSACSSGGGSTSAPPVIVDPPTLELTQPTQREDGSALSPSEIDSYRVYYGTAAGDYQIQVDIDPVNIEADLESLIGDLDTGIYYSVVTTVDTEGRESLYSAEIIVEI